MLIRHPIHFRIIEQFLNSNDSTLFRNSFDLLTNLFQISNFKVLFLGRVSQDPFIVDPFLYLTIVVVLGIKTYLRSNV
jgi:hypothetical protein